MRRLAAAAALAALLSVSCGGIRALGNPPDAEAVRAEAKRMSRESASAIEFRTPDGGLSANPLTVGLALVAVAAVAAILRYRARAGAISGHVPDGGAGGQDVVPPSHLASSADEAFSAAARGDFSAACVILNRAAVEFLVPDPARRAAVSNREVSRSLASELRRLFRPVFMNAERAEFGRLPMSSADWDESAKAWESLKGGGA